MPIPSLLAEALLFLLLAAPSHAFTIEPPLADAAQEARALALFGQVRCVVCQSESVADSPASVAADMRAAIRESVAGGASDDQTLAMLSERYGDRVRMRPPLNVSTLPLWLGTPLLLAGALLLARRAFRRPL